MVQHMLLARQLNQPAQHLPLKGLTHQQQSQVLSQYNHDQQRATAPMTAMVNISFSPTKLQLDIMTAGACMHTCCVALLAMQSLLTCLCFFCSTFKMA